MPFEVHTEEDLAAFQEHAKKNGTSGSRLLSVADILALTVSVPGMIIEHILPETGASLEFGAPKSNKTLLGVQMMLSIASGVPFCDFYKILKPGPVLVVEKDDPAAGASLKQILQKSPIPVDGLPFHLAERDAIPYEFGPEFITWLEGNIETHKLVAVLLDSYTALRGSRGAGIDIVKAEQRDLTQLDELGKRTKSAIVVVHHQSKGSAGMDWADKAAGTFAMSAATEAQIQVSRFADLEANAPERLVRVRGRHLEGTEMVLRFRRDTLDHEHVLEGGAAAYFPLIQQLRGLFGTEPFGPKELSHAMGVSRATAGRQVDRLHRSGILRKQAFGSYALVEVR